MLDWFNKIIQKIMFPTRKYLNRKFRENEENLNEQLQSIKESIQEINNAIDSLKNDTQNLCIAAKDAKESFHAIIDMQTKGIAVQNDLIDMVHQIERQSENNRNTFEVKINEIYQKVCENSEEYRKQSELQFTNLLCTRDELVAKINELNLNVCENTKEHHKQTELQIKNQKSLSEINAKIGTELKSLQGDLKMTNRTIEDANWAQVFHDTIVDSKWLANKAFSPGRWAAGYQMLYVMYRILNEVHPQDILELGMGQSTKLIMQYSDYYKVNHTVTEHDTEWIEKCNEDFSIPEHVNIVVLELGTTAYDDDPEVLIYKDFKQNVGNKKYDFICIDAPFGGNANKYARIDVLELIPECLNDDFIILLDDYNRKGEKNTGELIKAKLEEHCIAYGFGNYQGKKFTCVFASENYKFLTSL